MTTAKNNSAHKTRRHRSRRNTADTKAPLTVPSYFRDPTISILDATCRMLEDMKVQPAAQRIALLQEGLLCVGPVLIRMFKVAAEHNEHQNIRDIGWLLRQFLISMIDTLPESQTPPT